MRRVAIFTSSRADLGPLEPVIDAVEKHPGLELRVIATGTHLSASFEGEGGRLRNRFGERFTAVGEPIEIDESDSLGSFFGGIAGEVADALTEHDIDVLVLLGDRWELLAAAGAALLVGVHIAHLHGGEVTHGAMDDRIRHGISKIADIHFCATQESARRLRQLGEEPDRIVVSGAPGLDRLRDLAPLSDQELTEQLGHQVDRPFAVVVYHPPTVGRDRAEAEARAVYEAAASLGTAVVLYPGADPGADVVVDVLEEVAGQAGNLQVHRNLGQQYPAVLASADVLLGNSSSGIIEAPTLGVPVVNVGARQQGRQRAENVIDAATPADVPEALRRALSADHRQISRQVTNPYGDGNSGPRIAQALADIDLSGTRIKRLPASVTMLSPEAVTVGRDASLRDALAVIDKGAVGVALLVEDHRLVGTLTDGDARRALLRGLELTSPAFDVCNRDPVNVSATANGDAVLDTMLARSVEQVPVVDEHGSLVGLYVLRGVVEDMVRNKIRVDPI